MSTLSRIIAVVVTVAALLCAACSGESDPAITFTKDFIRKAATGDKGLTEMIDFELAANRYGTTEKEFIKKEGEEKWKKAKEDVVSTIHTTFAPLKESWEKSFRKFRIDERGNDYWIVSYLNPSDQRVQMMVKKRDGKMKGYFYSR